MDRIQQALDKARKDSDSKLAVSGAWRLRTGEPLGEVKYTQTNVLPADARHMVEQRLIATIQSGAASETYKILRTKVLRTIKNRPISSIAMISAQNGDGKTLTAINLAISLAMSGNHSVLLVDCDLRAPSIHRRFGISPERGLSDYLTGEVELEDCLVNPGINRLVLLPQIQARLDASELMASRAMADLARELTSRYPDRLVIFDLPPLLGTDDALVLLNCMDACLIVAREGHTRHDDVKKMIDLVRDKFVIGAVMNDVSGIL